MSEPEQYPSRVGRIEGRLDSLETKVDGIAEKLDRLLTREDERSGAEKALRQLNADAEAKAQRRNQIFAACGGGLAATAIQAIGRKLGWSP